MMIKAAISIKYLLFSTWIMIFPLGLTAQQQPYRWLQVTNAAAWQPRDSQGEVVYNGYMWLFGGWHSSYEAPPRDVWRSRDGKNWELVTDKAPWIHSDLPMTIAFQNKMWLMGGWFNGRLSGRSASNKVWSSEDGKHWTLVTDAAGWSPRCAAAIVSFKDKIWILGGTTDYYEGDTTSLLNDVWFSADGKQWTLATEDAGWPPRAYHQAVVLNDRIYLMGGGNYDPTYFAYRDVWSSADGIHWERETPAAPWHERIWFSSVVYKDHMWVIGGWSNNPYKNWSDTWYSRDGKSWSKLEVEGRQWQGRHEHSAYVFRNKLWIAGGMVPPLVNEVWSLSLPDNWR